MTQKRFKVEKQIFDGYCIVDNTINGYYAYEKQDLEKLCDSLNELNDENEQLKQFKEDVFSLFDKEITRNEEAIEWGKETGADSGAMGFYNHMLKRLKKELIE